jgi:hypothetical protein
MIDPLDAAANRRRAIDFIVAQTRHPLAQVAALYERESERLAASAHVQRYVPIFTYRNVLDQLEAAPVPP